MDVDHVEALKDGMPLLSALNLPPPSGSNADLDSGSHDSDSDDESSTKDAVKVSLDLPIFPSKDVKSYGDLIKKIATCLGLQYTEPAPSLRTVFLM